MATEYLSTDEILELRSRSFAPAGHGELSAWLTKTLGGRTVVKVELLADEDYTAVIWRFLTSNGEALLVNGGELVDPPPPSGG